MNDAAPRQLGKIRIEVQQSVLECPTRIARARVYDEPGRLIDDQKVPVLEGDLKVNHLGCDRDSIGQYGMHLDPLAPDDPIFRA